MKRPSLMLFVFALLAAMSLTLSPAIKPAVADGEGGNKVLHDAMELLSGHYRTVRRQMGDASKNAETANLLAEMGAATANAKQHLPKTATTDDLKNSYRVLMNKLIVLIAQAENAALAGEQDKLKDLVTEMNNVKKDGHALFIADDE